MTIALGLDPDLHHTGWAVVRSNGTLEPLAASIIRIPGSLTGEDAEIEMIYQLMGTLPAICREWNPDIVVVESQRIYPHSKSRPNDILRLARIAGACAASCMYPRRKLYLPPPQMGKTIKKEVLQARTQAKLSCGVDAACGWSQVKVSEQSHALDALTFAVWGLTEAK